MIICYSEKSVTDNEQLRFFVIGLEERNIILRWQTQEIFKRRLHVKIIHKLLFETLA